MQRTKLPLAILALGLPIAVAGAQTRVQILHASDLEGGVDAVADAPNFAAVVEALEADAAVGAIPSLLLSAGDNYIPGPFFSAAGDVSLRAVLQGVLGQPDAREGEGRVDVSIMNLLGFDASAIGNHEFDAGPAAYAGIIGTDIRNNFTQARWLGSRFPYLSSNLDFGNEPALSGLFTGSILPNTAFQGSLANLMAAAMAPPSTTASGSIACTEVTIPMARYLAVSMMISNASSSPASACWARSKGVSSSPASTRADTLLRRPAASASSVRRTIAYAPQ